MMPPHCRDRRNMRRDSSRLLPRSRSAEHCMAMPLTHRSYPKRWTAYDVRAHLIEVTTLLLAIEVLSPSSRTRDRVIKRRFLQRVAVPEYWVVDRTHRLVERW